MTSENVTFHFRVNGGEEQVLTAKSGIYSFAVAAIPAMFDVDIPALVEIWSPRVMPEYGPHMYEIHENDYGHIVIRHVVPISTQQMS